MRTKVKQDIASETSYLQLEIVYVLYCVSDSKEVFDKGMPVSRLTWGILQSTKKISTFIRQTDVLLLQSSNYYLLRAEHQVHHNRTEQK